MAAIVLVLALIVATGVVLVVKARNGDIRIPGLTLNAANDPGDDPFTAPVLVTNADLPDANRLPAQVGAPDNGARTVNGTQAGLYASTGSATCDTAALSNRLMSSPDTARAWAGVFGISPASIPYYLNTLTPVVLTADTWVTNHTYGGGGAHPFQSVLQAGTSVYVDGAGVPRAVCSCGNPLAPPAAAPIGGYRVIGSPWRGYRSTTVTRVAYENQHVTVVNNTTTVVPAAPTPAAGTPNTALLTLVNLFTSQLTEQRIGGGLNLTGVPPLTEQLPTAAALNTAYTPDSEDDATANGLERAGSTQAAAEVDERAVANNGVPEGAPESSAVRSAAAESAAAESPSTPGDVPSSVMAAPPSTPAAESTSAVPGTTTTETSESSETSQPPSPTSFSGVGDRIGSFGFDRDGSSVSCTVPATPDASLLQLSCSDSVSRSVSAGSLTRSAVTSATDAHGVWVLSLTEAGGSKTVAVSSAMWETIPTSTVPTTTVPTTTEIPTTTEVPTTEAPTTTTEEPTTTTEIPTTTEELVPPAPAQPEAGLELPSTTTTTTPTS
ncbi:DUF6777 domain-containing protein [Gordonia rhizosphera]|uniref:DUF6777 domain-containing protein n=1 Tax=Gordonia rhizosphera NBRC 16068 TaxID=1108045 RepID=K6WS77_9ACTN|nr:DUF6777 domain-containing protein [Gordonia rhizosphera]GAB89404.1 hypothetical protein GORHZ_060_00360 [Gordonia rhizosphera NBRC 16068]